MALKLYVKVNGKYEELSAIVAGPQLKPIHRTLVADAIKKYIEVCSTQKCKKNLKNETAYFVKLENFLKLSKAFCIDDITRMHIDQIESQFLKSMKPSSLNRRFSVYRHFFKKCIEWEYLAVNPMDSIKQKKIEKNHYEPWTDEEFKKFIDLCNNDYKKYFTFLKITGSRPVEAQNLRWTDVDYDNMNLKLKCFKNAKVSRTFPISNDVDKLLHSTDNVGAYVFLVNGKKPITSDNSYQYAKHRLKQLGFDNLTIYGLRHSFACKLSNAGLNAFEIQFLLGHVDIKTTRNYVHDDADRSRKKLNSVKFY